MKNILFVCTGNTCRSAMANGIFKFLNRKNSKDFSSDSCGIMTNGSPAAENAVLALKEMFGEDISSHQSKTVSRELVDWADEIFVVGKSHAGYILSYFPSAADKIYVATPEVSDPFMQGIDVYKNTANELYSQIESRYFSED